MSRTPIHESCLNCGAPLAGPYCARCGQEDVDVHAPLRSVVAEFLGEVFSLESRALRTLRELLFRPGHVTVECNAGRRARYSPPLRLYLLSSIVFFFALAVAPKELVRVSAGGERRADSTGVHAAAPGPGAEPAVQGPGARLSRRLEAGGRRAEQEPERFEQAFLQSWGWGMFVLMPAIAGMTQLLFRDRRRPYLHDLVFSVHFHSVYFLIFSLVLFLSHLPDRRVAGVAALPVALWWPGYLYLGLRRVYGRGRLGTLLRFLAGGLIYLLLLAAVMVGALFLTVLFFGD
ncbi:MAG: DUF3667 domain-containing protein [Gemmatimonadetes bacterium]|nr:DUF3667 domain-containing protein [Gemmatimonadota bacterium]